MSILEQIVYVFVHHGVKPRLGSAACCYTKCGMRGVGYFMVMHVQSAPASMLARGCQAVSRTPPVGAGAKHSHSMSPCKLNVTQSCHQRTPPGHTRWQPHQMPVLPHSVSGVVALLVTHNRERTTSSVTQASTGRSACQSRTFSHPSEMGKLGAFSIAVPQPLATPPKFCISPGHPS